MTLCSTKKLLILIKLKAKVKSVNKQLAQLVEMVTQHFQPETILMLI